MASHLKLVPVTHDASVFVRSSRSAYMTPIAVFSQALLHV